MATNSHNSERVAELKAFDETKAGVKGVFDFGITKLPNIFIHPPTDPIDPTHDYPVALTPSPIPIIDLTEAMGNDHVLRGRVVAKVLEASEKLGFFQVVGHGIPMEVLEEMIDGNRRFFERDLEEKKKYFTRDFSKPCVYNSNFDLYTSKAVAWRDSLTSVMTPTPHPHQLPLACRDIMLDYSKQVTKLAHLLLELLSEALRLPSDYLNEMGCGKGHVIISNYSPPCPEPEKTIRSRRHADLSFITILLQDHIGGLRFLHERQWFDVAPVTGAFVVNIGDLLKLVTNDKLSSVEHRVVAKRAGPRVSVATLFSGTRLKPNPRMYGPIKELLSETNPAKYKETTLTDFFRSAFERGNDGTSGLVYLKI